MSVKDAQIELKEGVVNVPPAVAAIATRSPKSLLIEACHAKWKAPPVIKTETVFLTRILLPNGSWVVEKATVHSDSQRKACVEALQLIKDIE